MLKDLLEQLDTGETDMDLTGYTEEVIESLMLQEHQDGDADADPQVDRAAELAEKWGVKTGDLWLIGEHRLLCGDSTKREDVARVMGGEKAQAVCTDPPYAIFGNSTGVAKDIADDNMVVPFFESLLKNASEILIPFGHCYCCCDWRSYGAYWQAAKRTDMAVKNCIVWDKGSGQGAMYANCCEWIVFLAKCPKEGALGKKATGHRTITEHAKNCIRLNRVAVADRGGHNAAKPVELMVLFLENSSDAGNVVMDFFLGSGTTMVASQNLGRRCYGIEITPGYCGVILQRMADAFPGIEIRKSDA
jgi:DNA modification methylase